MSEVEREHIAAALAAEHGRVEAAARRLGIPRSTIYQRINAYGAGRAEEPPRSTLDPPDSSR